jgi:hypothetical protein
LLVLLLRHYNSVVERSDQSCTHLDIHLHYESSVVKLRDRGPRLMARREKSRWRGWSALRVERTDQSGGEAGPLARGTVVAGVRERDGGLRW